MPAAALAMARSHDKGKIKGCCPDLTPSAVMRRLDHHEEHPRLILPPLFLGVCIKSFAKKEGV
jgi:hypothetical protein